MANISEMTQEKVDEYVANSRLLYSSLVAAIESGKITPTIQAKHERVYIREAVEGELIVVEADKASYTAEKGQYVVYNDENNRYLVSEKAYKRYESEKSMPAKTDVNGLEINGYKPKGKPQLIVPAHALEKTIDVNGFTYFPSGWWGSSNTVEKGFVFVLPFDTQKCLRANIPNFKKQIEGFPTPNTPKEDVAKYLSSGQGFDCYAIDTEYVATYALCDRSGTFADANLREKANQTQKYQGQNLRLSRTQNTGRPQEEGQSF